MDLKDSSCQYGRGFGKHLAKYLGVTPASVYQWISGVREIPESRQAEIQRFLICNGLINESEYKETKDCSVTPKPQLVHSVFITEVRVAY